MKFSVPYPTNLDKNVTTDEYVEIYKNIVRKYTRKHRHGKPITRDPEEINALDDQGYKMKADRYRRKREMKKVFKR